MTHAIQQFHIHMYVGVCLSAFARVHDIFITTLQQKEKQEEKTEQWREWLCNYFQRLKPRTFPCNQNAIIKNVPFPKPRFLQQCSPPHSHARLRHVSTSKMFNYYFTGLFHFVSFCICRDEFVWGSKVNHFIAELY